MRTSRLDKLGKVTVPTEIRQALNIQENDELEWVVLGNSVTVRKKQNSSPDMVDHHINFLRKYAVREDEEPEARDESESSKAMHEWYLKKLGLTE